MNNKKLFLFIAMLLLMTSFASAVNLTTTGVIEAAPPSTARQTLSKYTSDDTLYFNRGSFCTSFIYNITSGIINSTAMPNAPTNCNTVAYNEEQNELFIINTGTLGNIAYANNGTIKSSLSSSFFTSIFDTTSYNNKYYATVFNGDHIKLFDKDMFYLDQKTFYEMGLPFNDSDGNAIQIDYDKENDVFALHTLNKLYILTNSLDYFGEVYNLTDYVGTQDLRQMVVRNDTIFIRELSTGDIYTWEKYDEVEIPLILGETAYNRSGLCVDVNGDSLEELCTDAEVDFDSFGSVQITCVSLLETTACNLGCENIETDGFVSGVCENAVSPQECGFDGLLRCQTINTYAECNDDNGDGRLTYGNILNCPSNQVCVNTQLGAQCIQNNITSDVWTQDFINVNIDVNFTNAFEENTELINLASSTFGTTNFLTLGQGFIPLTRYFTRTVAEELTTRVNVDKISSSSGVSTQYSAISCDFTKNLVEQVFPENTVNSTQDYNKNLLTTSKNMELEIVFEEFETGLTRVQFTEDSSQVHELSINYNETEKRLIVYDEATNRIIYNQTSFQPTDDLRRLYIKGIFNKDIGQVSYELQIIRIPLLQDIIEYAYSLPFGYTNAILNTPDKISINTTGSLSVAEVTTTHTGTYPTFQYTNVQDEDIKVCTHISTGCKNIIVFGQESLNGYIPPTYHFYELVQSCPVQIGGATNEDLEQLSEAASDELDAFESLFGEPLTKNEKALIAIIAVLGIFGIFTGIYFQTQERIMLYAGVVTGTLVLFGFVLFGYLPAWLLIIIAIIGLWIATKRFIGD